MILKKYSNQLLQEIINQGLDVQKFRINEIQRGYEDQPMVLRLKQSQLAFTLHTPANDFNLFSCGYNEFKPSFPHYNATDQKYLRFSEILPLFSNWLNNDVKLQLQELQEPDYWKIVSENPLISNGIDFNKNEPFTEAEKVQLKIGFTEIKLLLSQKFELSVPQLEATNKKLDYFVEATQRLNKTDWKGIAVNTMFLIASDLMLDEQKRATFFGLFSKLWAIVQHLQEIIH